MFLFLYLACVGGGDDSAPEATTCETLEADYAAEKARIQACEVAEDCGQQLVGTSCGCTRDLVARADADTTAFFALRDQAHAEDCEINDTSTCDCPEADGFACVDQVCTWNYL